MKKDLHYWFSMIEEYDGYECEGHFIPHLVIAETLEEALDLLKPYLVEGGTKYTKPAKLPNLLNFRKPRELNLWKLTSYSELLEVPYEIIE